MTNTKFRRRALVSSIAMLLVALVALGSATFAWFAENPETQNVWGKSAVLNYSASTPTTFNLTPASQVQANTGTFYTMTASAPNGYGAKDDAAITTLTPGHIATSPVYVEKVYFSLTPGAAENASRDVKLTGVTITPADNATMAGCIRVSVTNSSDELIGTYAYSGADENDTIPLLTTGQSKYQDVKANLVEFNPALKTGSGKITDTATAATAVKTSKTTQVSTYDAAEIISSIKLDFALAAA